MAAERLDGRQRGGDRYRARIDDLCRTGACSCVTLAERANLISSMPELGPNEKGPQAWKRYWESLSTNERVGRALARHVRWWWDVLSEDLALPPPLADLTADEERFQLAWSYHHVLLEVDVHRDGRIEWFGKDRVGGACDGGDSARDARVDPKLRTWLEKILLGIRAPDRW
jgi:hypothetical protein